ncbi:MAG: serine/threonine-protein phosphatase, partial [Gemmatimonadetes bacterium]
MIRTGTLTSPGGRDENQDALGHRDANGGTACWVVADGLGGHDGGRLAAQLCVEAALDAFEHRPAASSEVVRAMLEAAQQRVLEERARQPELDRMRTTAVVLVSDGISAAWGHVGDSRLYRFSAEGRAQRLTRDDSVPQALVDMGEISEAEMRAHDDRSRLLRSLGGDGALEATVADPVPVHPGESFLLCSDGFWEYVT